MEEDIFYEHLQITEDVKSQIQDMRIVFPSYYGKLYADAAEKYRVQLSPEHLIDHEMLDERLVRHIITLGCCAEDAVQAMESGDKDKLVSVMQETKVLREEIKELQRLVYEDTLTKAFNRRWFEDNWLKDSNTKFAQDGMLVVVDIDRFKRINDAYGHVIGDKVLIHVAEKLKSISKGDVVRYGGDEFVIVYDETVSELVVNEEMNELIEFFSRAAFKLSNGDFKITFSYGMKNFDENEDFLSVIDYADRQMYENKNKNIN